MLTEKQMDAALAIFQARMEEISEIYFEKMGKHIRQIGQLAPSDVHRLQQLRRLNRNLADIEKRLAKAADLNIRDLETVLREAAKADERVVKKITGVSDAEVRLENNVPLQRALRAQLLETGGRMANLSNTTVVESAYRNAVDAAVTAAQSGAEDYESAIRRTLARAGEMGLRVRENGTKAVTYASGRSLRVDTAVRMNVLDAMRRMNQRAMEEVGRQFGADGVEIDAHMLCAEDHLPYQGGQYSNEEFEQIQDSLDRPFGEWNCRHTWSPIILGVSPPAYPEEELERFRKYSTEEVTIDGQTRTRYEWSQVMRRMETAIREKKDTATLARAAGDDQLRRQCQGSVNAMMQEYERLSDRTGLGPDFRRTYVAGFRDVKNTGDVGAPNNTTIDWASANNLANGDARLTNMLRSGDVQQTASAVNEILNGDGYGFKESKWSGRAIKASSDSMGNVLGRKEWSCDISIRADNIGNVKTHIHENLHSRSASYFSPDTFARNKASEEASVEYMSQQICIRAGVPYTPSYTEGVGALQDLL